MLMGRRKPLVERPAVLGLGLAATLGLGLALGAGIGHWVGSSKTEPPPARPAAPALPLPPFTAPAEEEEPAAPPAVSPAPPPASSEALDTAHPEAEVAMAAPPIAAVARLPAAPPALWLRNAVAASRHPGRPMIAVIIDDLGIDRRRSARVAALRPPLTLSYLTYAEELPRQTQEARRHGHELLVHVPMQPSGSIDPGPGVLEVGQSAAEIRRRLDWGLGRFDGYVGINNHMGSRFTADRTGMEVVMDELRRRGLAFVDSVTSERTVGAETAHRHAVPFAARQVFIDNDPAPAQVRAQLARAEAVARRHGMAIVIGHPHDGTIEALTGWLPGLAAQGLDLVPVSAIIRAGQGG